MRSKDIISEFELLKNDFNLDDSFIIKDFPYGKMHNNAYIGIDKKYLHYIVEINSQISNKEFILNEILGYRLIENYQVKGREINCINVYSDIKNIDFFSFFIMELDSHYDINNPLESIAKTQFAIKNHVSTLNKPLDLQKQKGLWGELYLLTRISDDISHVVKNNWSGPKNGLHDFVFDRFELEVKTTTSEPTNIIVSSPQQLIPSKNKQLKLIVVKIKESNKGFSLREIITNVNDSLENNAIELFFNELLLNVGYKEEHDHHYNIKYIVTEVKCININEDTKILNPKVLQDIPSTVFDITYKLHVDSLESDNIKDDLDFKNYLNNPQ